jgi:hypothetical protein
MAFKIEQLLLNENSVTLIKINTIYYVKVARTKIMELEAKVKLLEKQKSFWNDKAFVADKKAIILI